MASILLILFLSIFALGEARKLPGIQIRVKPRGVHYASQLGLAMFEENLRSIIVPDVLSDHTNKDFIRYGLTGIKIDSLFLENSTALSLKSVDNSGLQLEADDMALTLHGKYFFRIGTESLSATKRGHLVVNLRKMYLSVRMSLGMSLGADGKGRISIGTSQCQSSVGDVQFKFYGDFVDDIIEELQGAFDWALKKEIGPMVCEQLNYDIDHDADTQLLGMKVEIKVPGMNGVYFDYSLVQAPLVSKDSVIVSLAGEGFVPTAGQSFLRQPGPLQFIDSNEEKMAELALSEDSIASILESWYSTGAIDQIITQAMVKRLSPDSAHYLNISCTDFMCLGSLLPTVDKKFGGASLWIDSKAASAPKVSLLEEDNTVEIDLSFNLDMRALYPNEALIPIFNTRLSLTLTLKNITLSSSASKLHLRADSIDTSTPQVKLNSVNVDGVSDNDVAIVFQFAIPFAMDYVQAPVQTGISFDVPLPFMLEDSSLKVLNGSAVLATDVSV